jgi:hypothetical protein
LIKEMKLIVATLPLLFAGCDGDATPEGEGSSKAAERMLEKIGNTKPGKIPEGFTRHSFKDGSWLAYRAFDSHGPHRLRDSPQSGISPDLELHPYRQRPSGKAHQRKTRWTQSRNVNSLHARTTSSKAMIAPSKAEADTESLPIDQQVRKWKEEVAAQYNYDVHAIGKAMREAQKQHPERVVNRAALLAENDGTGEP